MLRAWSWLTLVSVILMLDVAMLMLTLIQRDLLEHSFSTAALRMSIPVVESMWTLVG